MDNLNGITLLAQADILRRAHKAGLAAQSLEAFLAAIERRARQLEEEALTHKGKTAPRAVLECSSGYLYNYVPGFFMEDHWVWLYPGPKLPMKGKIDP